MPSLTCRNWSSLFCTIHKGHYCWSCHPSLHLHRPTWLLTFILSPTMVIALCAHLLIGH